jgi:hypothetical protein
VCVQVDSLKAQCVSYMEQDVTAEKACVLFVEGRKLLNEPAFGLAFIEENIEDIAKTDGFVDLPRDCLEAILRSGKLLIDEGDLWTAVDRWAASQCRRDGKKPDGPAKREVLGTALQLVRFPLIEMVTGHTLPSLLSVHTPCADPSARAPPSSVLFADGSVHESAADERAVSG